MTVMPIMPIDRMCEGLTGYHDGIVRASANPITARLLTIKPFGIFNPARKDAYYKACANYVWAKLYVSYMGVRPNRRASLDYDIYWVCSSDARRWTGPTRTAYYDSAFGIVKRMDMLIARVKATLPISTEKGIMQRLPFYDNYTS